MRRRESYQRNRSLFQEAYELRSLLFLQVVKTNVIRIGGIFLYFGLD